MHYVCPCACWRWEIYYFATLARFGHAGKYSRSFSPTWRLFISSAGAVRSTPELWFIGHIGVTIAILATVIQAGVPPDSPTSKTIRMMAITHEVTVELLLTEYEHDHFAYGSCMKLSQRRLYREENSRHSKFIESHWALEQFMKNNPMKKGYSTASKSYEVNRQFLLV